MWNVMGCGTLGIGLSLDALTDTWEDGAVLASVAAALPQRYSSLRQHGFTSDILTIGAISP